MHEAGSNFAILAVGFAFLVIIILVPYVHCIKKDIESALSIVPLGSIEYEPIVLPVVKLEQFDSDTFRINFVDQTIAKFVTFLLECDLSVEILDRVHERLVRTLDFLVERTEVFEIMLNLREHPEDLQNDVEEVSISVIRTRHCTEFVCKF